MVKQKLNGGYLMKKLLSLSLAVVLIASIFAGCAKKDGKDDTATTSKSDATYVILEEALAEEEYSVGFRDRKAHV